MTISLRTGAVLCGLLMLTACNSLTSDTISSFRLLFDEDRNRIPAERVNDPRAETLLVSTASAQGLFIAPPGSHGQIQWRGVTEQLETDNGRITQLVGMDVEVLVPLAANDPFRSGLIGVADGTRISRLVDLPLTYQTGLHQEAVYYRGPLEAIGQQSLQRIDEHIRMEQIGFQTTNYYWLDPETGRVRRSIQNPAPGLPTFDLLFTHQPARGKQP